MLITLDQLPADAVAELQMQRDLPGGVVMQPVDLRASLAGGTYRVTLSLILGPGAAPAQAAAWLWPRIEAAVPLVMSAGDLRARVAEEAAVAWLIAEAQEG